MLMTYGGLQTQKKPFFNTFLVLMGCFKGSKYVFFGRPFGSPFSRPFAFLLLFGANGTGPAWCFARLIIAFLKVIVIINGIWFIGLFLAVLGLFYGNYCHLTSI